MSKRRHEKAEHTEVDRELRETSQRLNALIENSPLAWIEWDENYRIRRWTPEAARLFGWTAEEVLGKRMDELRWVYEEDWPIVQELMNDMSAGRRVRNVNPNRNYRKDGTVIYSEWYNSVLEDDGQVTGVLSLVLDVTRRVEAEKALARARESAERQVHQLQRALLPPEPPHVEGYELAWAYIPAFAGQEIGGDFYDVFETEDGKLGILIGDVSGKGIESAAMAAATRSTVHAFAYDSSDPADSLYHANSVLSVPQVAFGQFVTSFLLILDTESGRLLYSNAGHPPALIRRSNGHIDTLSILNMPLGILSGKGFEGSESVLNCGDKIIVYTDGITEARSDSVLFGVKGVERVLQVHGGEGPEAVVAEVLAAAGNWAHGKLRDDTAVVVVERE